MYVVTSRASQRALSSGSRISAIGRTTETSTSASPGSSIRNTPRASPAAPGRRGGAAAPSARGRAFHASATRPSIASTSCADTSPTTPTATASGRRCASW